MGAWSPSHTVGSELVERNDWFWPVRVAIPHGGLRTCQTRAVFHSRTTSVTIPLSGLRTRRRKMGKVYVSNALSPSHTVGLEHNPHARGEKAEAESPSHTVGLEPHGYPVLVDFDDDVLGRHPTRWA